MSDSKTHTLSTIKQSWFFFPLNTPFIFYKCTWIVGWSLASFLSTSFILRSVCPPVLEWRPQDIKQSSWAVGGKPSLGEKSDLCFLLSSEIGSHERESFYQGTYFLTNAVPTLKTGFVLILNSLAQELRVPRHTVEVTCRFHPYLNLFVMFRLIWLIFKISSFNSRRKSSLT